MADQTESTVARRVQDAFEALRRGDATLSAELVRLGPAIIPQLGAYLGDPLDEVRRQSVALLAALGGESAIPFLGKALEDRSSEVRSLAARALYDKYEPPTLARRRELAAPLRSIARRDRSAQALLLLAYFPSTETQCTLEDVKKAEPVLLEFRPWTAPVPRELPALVAGSRLGVRDMRTALLSRIETAPDGEIVFLLLALREIDAPEVLHLLARRALADDSEISGGADGVPSGAAPRRRLCDMAVDTLAQRLQIRPTFPLTPSRRYSQSQIDEIARSIRGSMPQ